MKYLQYEYQLFFALTRFLRVPNSLHYYRDEWDNGKYYYFFDIVNGVATCAYGRLQNETA